MAGTPFLTPANERSFSGLVDRAILETGKQFALLSAIQYANLTIRECQKLGLFAQDLIEDELETDAVPFIWTRPANFRSIRSVKYTLQNVWPKLRLPGKVQHEKLHYFYGADDYFAFAGLIEGEPIAIAVYYYRKPLLYYGMLGTVTTGFQGGPYSIRPAYYDVEAEEWMYLNVGQTAYVDDLADDDEELLRRTNAMNWLLTDWWDVVLEGVKAKIFKQYNDPRASLSYSLYKEGQRMLQNLAGFEAEVSAMGLPGGD